MTSARLPLALALVAAAILAGYFSLRASETVSAAPATPPTLAQKSRALATEARVPFGEFNMSTYSRSAEAIQAVANEVALGVPVPEGATGITDVDAAAGAAAGGASRAVIEFTVQFRARCAWYAQAAKSGPGSVDSTTRTIINEIPQWSAFRSTEVGDRSQKIAEQLADGNTELLKQDAASCPS